MVFQVGTKGLVGESYNIIITGDIDESGFTSRASISDKDGFLPGLHTSFSFVEYGQQRRVVSRVAEGMYMVGAESDGSVPEDPVILVIFD